VALGLAVKEETATKVISVKEVMNEVNIVSISTSAKNRVKVGDVLVAIRDENVRHMPLMRVAQKLNDFRVPVSSQVKLTFERRERLDGEEDVIEVEAGEEPGEEQEEDRAQDEAEVDPESNDNQSDSKSGSKPGPERKPSSYNFDDIDETSPEERRSNNNSAASTPMKSTSHSEKESGPGIPRPASAKIPRPPSMSMSHLDPVKYVAAIAENEELAKEIEEKNQMIQEQLEQQQQMQEKVSFISLNI
jgi:hypothetical protein